MAPSQIIVKRYKSDREFQTDARKMASKGYEVQSVTSEQPRSGCARILLIGIFAAIFKPKPVLVVTYRLSWQNTSRGPDYSLKQSSLINEDSSGREIFRSNQNTTKKEDISKW